MKSMSVLFLCTQNSCRSQIAEALANHHYSPNWKAFSAGSKPANEVHPLARQVLSELEITQTGRPKSVDSLRGLEFDLIVTLCDEAENECPIWLGQGKRIHLPFPDPAAVDGSPQQKIQAFRKVRDQIQEGLSQILGNNQV